MSFHNFTWRGERISNIEEWALGRGERMVKYEATRQTPYGPETVVGAMPESFWNGLLWSDGWYYKEIE
jgi:hypothetical protein